MHGRSSRSKGAPNRPGSQRGQTRSGDAGSEAEGGTDTDTGSDAEEGVDTDTEADGAAPPEMPTPTFLVGYNEGWFNTGFGTDLTSNFDLATVNRTFDGIIVAGGHVVRQWLFHQRQGLVLGASAPQTQGVDPAMLDNLDEVLRAARARGLWVYLTVLEGNEMTHATGPLRDYYWNLLNNEYGEGDAFNDLVLVPLLELLDEHREVIFGLDLMNEIEAPRSDGYWPNPLNGPRAFIQRTTAFIKARAPWIRVTSTAGWDNAQYDISGGFFSGLGLDFYDLPAYSDSGTYDGATAVCDRAAADGVPVILGEFGQHSDAVIDDTLQSNVTATFLSTARSLCFAAAIAWRYDYGPSCWDFVREDGSFRPAVSIMQAYGALP